MKVLFVGGTGTISASAVRLAVAQDMDVTVLNRGENARQRTLPESVTWLRADVRDASATVAALGERTYDAVVNFLCYTAAEAEESVAMFGKRTAHYIHISTASIYHKPILQVPIGESTARHNPFLKYAREKIAAEDTLMEAFQSSGFPVTIVRPSHTYDEASPPLAGAWNVFDRITRGVEVISSGDGTSLWTVTHARDFAQGLVGLLGNSRAVGETFHITSDDVYTWDQILSIVGGALGVEPRIVHVPAEFFPLVAPEWPWSELMVGDLSHSALFDNAKIRRYVPSFTATTTFQRTVHEMVRWRSEHTEASRPDPAVDAIMDRLVAGYHGSRDIFAALAPAASHS